MSASRCCWLPATRLFEPKKAYAPGEKVYFIQENKAVVAATIGQKPYEEGFRLVIAHIDCPRLDLRPNPPVRV